MGKILTHAIFIIVFTSCVKTREIILPQEKDKLVINCLFNTDSVWAVNISATKPVTSNLSRFVEVNDANVRLYENEILIGTLISTGRGNYTLNTYPKFGKKYKISVDAPNYDVVYAEDSITQPAGSITFAEINTKQTIEITEQKPPYLSYSVHPVSLQIKDNANDLNFYKVSIIRELNDTAQLRQIDELYSIFSLYNFYYIYSNDQTLNRISSDQCFLLFSNDYFKAQHKNIIATTNTSIYTTVSAYPDTVFKWRVWGDVTEFSAPPSISHINYDLYLELRTISRAYYNYSFSLLQQIQAVNDPFAEFKNVYTNVKGGYGIFAGFQTVRQKVN